jgi:hypothetical protein
MTDNPVVGNITFGPVPLISSADARTYRLTQHDGKTAVNLDLVPKARYDALLAERQSMLANMDAMHARIKELEPDAERYLWLCECKEWPDDVAAAIDCSGKVLIDIAIDAARDALERT